MLILTENRCRQALMVLLALVAAAYGAADIVDTDAWMHLSLGRYLLDNGIPAVEPFVFTAPEESFFYSSWLFGVSTYWVYLVAGMAGLVIAKAVLSGGLYALLYRYALARSGGAWLAFVVLMLSLVWVAPRFVLRPDLLFFFFLLSSLLCVELSRDRPWWLLGLPPIFILWANTHSSVILGVVPVGYAVLYHFFTKPQQSWSLKRWGRHELLLALVLLVTLGAPLLNPNGAEQFLYGANVVTLEFFKEEIGELRPPTWEREASVILYALGVLCLQLGIVLIGLLKKRLSPARLADALVVMLLVALFFYSRRFQYPLLLVSLPILVAQLSSMQRFSQKFTIPAAVGWAIAGIALAIAVAGVPSTRLDQSLEHTPENALQWMQERGIKGDLFNTFRYGGYIVWRDYPQRRVFIDPRGKIPVQLMESNRAAHTDFSVLTQLSDRFDFNYALLSRATMGFDYLDPEVNGFPNKDWALVYWDDQSVVLARRGRMQASLARYEYELFSPALLQHLTTRYFRGEKGRRLLDEVMRNARQSNNVDAQVAQAVYLISVQRFQEAQSLLFPLLSNANGRARVVASYMMASIYRLQGEFGAAQTLYLSTLDSVAHLKGALLELAGISVAQGNYRQAHLYVDQLLEKYPDNIKAIETKLSIFRASGAAGKDPEYGRWAQQFQKMQQIASILDLGAMAYTRGDLDAARKSFHEVLVLQPDNAQANFNLALVDVQDQRLGSAARHFLKAARKDDTLAYGYYRAGVIMMDEGNDAEAIGFLQEYLRNVDQGRYARDARRRIRQFDLANGEIK
ncbi:tetratricopeptide repeat protein [Aestuariirhabdus sp. LZHN29]|uniref:tetratricopeptide repeat protein n=1 Tax=Aestuariirhabdus sp. LZHN29 TaxID=3417462 RepID=UPI003CF40557